MADQNFIDDIAIKLDSDGVVYKDRPDPFQAAAEFAETWRYIDGKGLYHFKRYEGQWFSRLFTDTVKTFNEEIREVSIENIIVQSGEGTFSEIKVTTELDITGATLLGLSFGSPLVRNAGGQVTLPYNTTNFQISNNEFNTIQDIATSSNVEFGDITSTGSLSLNRIFPNQAEYGNWLYSFKLNNE